MRNCLICSDDIPNYIVIDGKGRNISKRKYCLTCSPFGQHNTTDPRHRHTRTESFCPKCQMRKPIGDFHVGKTSGKVASYCRRCNTAETIKRKNAQKARAVEYKGGKCVKCGYNRCLSALDFHHRDQSQKEFNISDFQKYEWDKLKKELDKCDIVCATCHREIHAGYEMVQDEGSAPSAFTMSM